MLGPGAIVGGFRIQAVIGQGGMGLVYRATEVELQRDVALKLVAPVWATDAHFRSRFRKEARLAASVEHPHVLPIYETGESDGLLYLAMRLVRGPDLGQLVRQRGPLEPRRAVAMIAQAAGALDAAHRAGVIHRDIKPSNILVDPGEGVGHVYLADFGLARLAGTEATATNERGWAGTADYAAPEQIRGDRGDAATDVYALGGVLHWALTGQVPFPRQTHEAKLWAHLHEPPSPPSAIAQDVPRALDAVVVRALEKQPDDRYPSAGALAREAAKALAAGDAGARRSLDDDSTDTERTTVMPAAPPSAAGPPASRRTHRTRRRAGLALAVAGAAGVTAAALLSGDGPDPRSPPRAERTPAPRPPSAHPARPYDFNGDGRQEVLVGLPTADVSGATSAGAALVLNARRPRASLAARPLVQGGLGVPGKAHAAAAFGAAVTSGDFNADGRGDVALGAPNADPVAGGGREGEITVLYGTSRGLRRGKWHRFEGPAGFGDAEWGAALVAVDVDRDRFADLVIGAPGATGGDDERGSGVVTVLFGGSEGLSRADARTLRRPRGERRFGAVLALGDVNGDRNPDLLEAGGIIEGASGHASFCPGTPTGPAQCERMGRAASGGPVTIGVADIRGDGIDDVVHGMPEDGGDGAVYVWPGTLRGPDSEPLVIRQRAGGVPIGTVGDRFGQAIASADLDRDGHDDLLVGAPGADGGTGRISFIRGTSFGPLEPQAAPAPFDGIPPAVAGGRFGAQLSLLDLNGDKQLDLIVGSPGEERAGGAIAAFTGNGPVFTTGGSRSFSLGQYAPGGSRTMALGRRGRYT